MFSALEVFYENALYKFTSDIDIKRSRHLYAAIYGETRTAAVYNNRSGVLTGTSSRRRGAINRPLPERTDFGRAVAA